MNAQALLAAIVCLSYYGNQGGRLFFGLQDFLGVGTLLNDPDTEFPQDENDSQSWCPSDATGRMIHSGGSRSWICHHLPPGAAHLPRWGKHPCLCELHPFLPPEIQRKLTNNVDNLKCFCTPPPHQNHQVSWQWTMLPLSPIFTYSTILSAISQSLLPSVDVNIPTCRLTPIYQFPVHCVFPLASPLSKSGSWTDTICPSLRPWS